MTEKGPTAPTPKPVRKPATQANMKEPSQKNLPKQNLEGYPSIGTKNSGSTNSACRSTQRPSPSLSAKPTKSIA